MCTYLMVSTAPSNSVSLVTDDDERQRFMNGIYSIPSVTQRQHSIYYIMSVSVPQRAGQSVPVEEERNATAERNTINGWNLNIL